MQYSRLFYLLSFEKRPMKVSNLSIIPIFYFVCLNMSYTESSDDLYHFIHGSFLYILINDACQFGSDITQEFSNELVCHHKIVDNETTITIWIYLCNKNYDRYLSMTFNL